MQPLHCVLQHHVHIHATSTMRFASLRCRTPRRNRLRSKRSKPQPPHTRAALHRRPQPLYPKNIKKHQVSCSGFLPNTSPMQHSCSHYNAFCSTLHTSMRCRTPRKNRLLETIPAAPAAHTSCLSSPAAATLHGKTQGFMPRLPPQGSITSLSHQPSSSPLPLVTTTTSLSHHFSWAPLPLVTTLRHHHFP